MRELLYDAARHYKRGRALADRGDVRGAMGAYKDALRELHAVKPQRMRDVLLAQVYLSRYSVGRLVDVKKFDSDLRVGYSYARTTQEPTVRNLAEQLWQQRFAELQLEPEPELPNKPKAKRSSRRGRKRRRPNATEGSR